MVVIAHVEISSSRLSTPAQFRPLRSSPPGDGGVSFHPVATCPDLESNFWLLHCFSYAYSGEVSDLGSVPPDRAVWRWPRLERLADRGK